MKEVGLNKYFMKLKLKFCKIIITIATGLYLTKFISTTRWVRSSSKIIQVGQVLARAK